MNLTYYKLATNIQVFNLEIIIKITIRNQYIQDKAKLVLSKEVKSRELLYLRSRLTHHSAKILMIYQLRLQATRRLPLRNLAAEQWRYMPPHRGSARLQGGLRAGRGVGRRYRKLTKQSIQFVNGYRITLLCRK